MAITIQCKNGHTLRVKDDAAGKKVRCPECQTVLVVDDDAEPDDEDPSPSRAKPAAKKSRGKSRGKKKNGSSALIWVIAGGTGVAVLTIAAVLFFVFQSPAAGNSQVAQSESPAAVAAPETAAPEKPVEQTAPPAAVPPANPEKAPATTAVAEAAPAKEPAPIETPSTTNETTAAALAVKSAPTGKLKIWDTGEGTATATNNLAGPGQNWTAVATDSGAAHKFTGDCVVENGKLWLHLPREASVPVRIAAKSDNGPEMVIPVTFNGGDSNATGDRTLEVVEYSQESVAVKLGGAESGPQVICRVAPDKYWAEFKPQSGAEQLAIGTNAPYVVVPTKFGEDAICDAAVEAARKTISLPNENMVVALERAANTLSVLTYPSPAQAGEITITPGSAANSAASVTSISAKFTDNHSVFVGLLPQKDQWFSEGVGKKYSAAGQYVIGWKPPYGGIWRLIGRIPEQSSKNKKSRPTPYYVTDVVPERFIFSCSQSGTLECLIGYLSRAESAASTELATPMSIYRETLGETGGAAYLLDTEFGGSIYRGMTKYRDVCNSIDDMKGMWRAQPDAVRANPGAVNGLLGDCKLIITRIDQRLQAYQELTEHVGQVFEQLSSVENDKGSSEFQSFTTAVRTAHNSLKAIKAPDAARVDQLAGEIDQKLQKSGKLLNVGELDRTAERIRDVANHQEKQLKTLRGIILQLSDACNKHRDVAEEPLKNYVTSLGQHCRKVLRFRDTEE